MPGAMSLEAPTSTAPFLTFVNQVVLAALKPDKTAAVAVRFLPRLSPAPSPIEPGWSKLKAVLRT
ncbi:hypothetical protein DS837_28015 [Azospirillum brasilense]|uniref:Uncharacterized protein n=1 Tax=Azospirillum brasilense TaxID=192 RepID=A0A6L3ASG3_AZOBR|nr:hypothetical protein DS837_28015 [Azospirillum brasilense]